MKLISVMIGSISIGLFATAAPAKCPSQLAIDDMHECIKIENSSNLSYREWATGFYQKVDPDKALAIIAAYSAAKEKVIKQNVPSSSLKPTP